jgi:hypothetical protein
MVRVCKRIVMNADLALLAQTWAVIHTLQDATVVYNAKPWMVALQCFINNGDAEARCREDAKYTCYCELSGSAGQIAVWMGQIPRPCSPKRMQNALATNERSK